MRTDRRAVSGLESHRLGASPTARSAQFASPETGSKMSFDLNEVQLQHDGAPNDRSFRLPITCGRKTCLRPISGRDPAAVFLLMCHDSLPKMITSA